jgi:FkbM family methyltransferase
MAKIMYSTEVHIRQDTVGGVGPWTWIKSDNGAWDGPKSDWETSHVAAIRDLVTDWSVCVQAGGNQGMYPRLLSEMFGRVYTFEPDPLNFYCLVDNCQKDNIYKMQAALGAQPGLVRINRGPMTNTGTHTVSADGVCTVPMVTIDSLQLDSCGFIMLDIERYEYQALLGAMQTIERFRPVIQCECGNDDILNLIGRFGYRRVATSKADTLYKVV